MAKDNCGKLMGKTVEEATAMVGSEEIFYSGDDIQFCGDDCMYD